MRRARWALANLPALISPPPTASTTKRSTACCGGSSRAKHHIPVLNGAQRWTTRATADSALSRRFRHTMTSTASRGRIAAAFAAIYIIWGSTYLAIRFAVETIAPFLMAGTRFVISGAVLFGITVIAGNPRPTRIHWRNAAIVGAALLLLGNGVLGWAEQFIPSGFASIIVAIVPLWMVILDWARPDGHRPSRAVVLGLVLGTIGLMVLLGPAALAAVRGEAGSNGGIRFGPAAVLILSSFAWAAGSLFSRYAELPRSSSQATGMEMLSGGVLLLVAGVLAGEPASLDLARVSSRSLLGLVYLIMFGSFVGFTAYIWLLKVVPL